MESPRQLRATVLLDTDSEEFMRRVMSQMNRSGRVFDRIVKVARTIADLAGDATVRKAHVAESVQYRERGPS